MCLPGEGTDACEIPPGGTRVCKDSGDKSSPEGTKTPIASAVYTLLCQLATARDGDKATTRSLELIQPVRRPKLFVRSSFL